MWRHWNPGSLLLEYKMVQLTINLKKLTIELSDDPAILLLGIYLKELKTDKQVQVQAHS